MEGGEGGGGEEEGGGYAGGYGVEEEEVESAFVGWALGSGGEIDLIALAGRSHRRREHRTGCVDEFSGCLLQVWWRDAVSRRKSDQFSLCIFQNPISCNLLVHGPFARRCSRLTVEMDTRGCADLAVRALHVDQCAQRQRGLLGLCGLLFGELEIVMVPHVVMDC